MYTFSFDIEMTFNMKKEKEFENGLIDDSILKIFESSPLRPKQSLKKIPEIRWDKVIDFRKKLASNDWHPKTEKIAEKLLYEHLYIPAP